MNIQNELNVEWKKILLIWNWWDKNLWDELILIWNMKLLLKQKKKLFIATKDINRLKDFHKQFFDNVDDFVYIHEIPKGIRSFCKYIIKWDFKTIKYFFQVDSVIVWWGEIMTQETPYSYFFWFISILPVIRKKLYLMWGIQIPDKFFYKIIFKRFIKKASKILLRDFQWVKSLQEYWAKNVEFFMDTSYFSIDRKKLNKFSSQQKKLWLEWKKYIAININEKWKKYLDDIIKDVEKYIQTGYKILFIPVRIGKFDDDSKFYDIIKSKLTNRSDKKFFLICDWTDDFYDFLALLNGAQKVISVRLHLFLIAKFMWLDVKVYPYQKKIIKMSEVLKHFSI